MATDRNLSHSGTTRKGDAAGFRLDPAWRRYNERLREAEGKRLLGRLEQLLERLLAQLERRGGGGIAA